MTDALLTAADVSARLKVSMSTVRRFISSGELESVKLSPGRKGGRRVTEQALTKFLKTRGA